jgi:hypothetical protein
MKKINTIVIAIAASIALLSCSKQASGPSGSVDGGDVDQQVTSVVSETWFSAVWQANGEINQYTRNVAQLTAGIIKNGKVLVFAEGGFEMRPPSALPGNFDANYISFSPVVGQLKLNLLARGAISSTLQFRYILIPAKKLASGNLDYADYNAVCDYYHLPK